MDRSLRPTTTQAARGFLGALGFRIPGTTAPGDVLALLTAKVRERRDDPEARRLLQALVADLEAPGGELPDATCETRDAQALARELAAILGNGEPAKRYAAAPQTATAALLLVLATAPITGCASCQADPACATDRTIGHFRSFVDQAPTKPLSSTALVDCFVRQSEDKQLEVIEDLCAMTPEEVGAYLNKRFGARGDLGCFPPASAPLYKGVAL